MADLVTQDTAKPYWVFAGDGHPNGGMSDLHSTYDTLLQAMVAAKELTKGAPAEDWAQVLTVRLGAVTTYCSGEAVDTFTEWDVK